MFIQYIAIMLWMFNELFGNTVESRYLEVDGTILYTFKLPEVQIDLHFG